MLRSWHIWSARNLEQDEQVQKYDDFEELEVPFLKERHNTSNKQASHGTKNKRKVRSCLYYATANQRCSFVGEPDGFASASTDALRA